MSYYAVCYGHACRFEKAPFEDVAVKQAFGVSQDSRTTVEQMPSSPKGMSHKKTMEFLAPLAVKHFRRTGSILSGWEKHPGIHNVHWTQCQLCRRNILTEPADKGEDDALCQECEPKYSTLTEEQKEVMSISDMRKHLNITLR